MLNGTWELTPKGTYLFGGLGTDSAYADKIIQAFISAKISNAFLCDIWAWRFSQSLPLLSTIVDASWGVLRLRWFYSQHGIGKDIFSKEGVQFNLIGYSYGGLIVSQLAAELLRNSDVTIDNLVLIGAPVSSEQLRRLR